MTLVQSHIHICSISSICIVVVFVVAALAFSLFAVLVRALSTSYFIGSRRPV